MTVLPLLRRLRGRSMAELRDRAATAASVVADRWGWVPVPALTSPVSLPQTPFGHPAAPSAVLPGAVRDALVARADMVLARRFPLLGFDALEYGTPVDWHRDPLRGLQAPLVHWSRVPYLDAARVGDHKLTWEVNRHQWLYWLGQAWCLAGDRRYPQFAVSLVDEWMHANPPRRGINWASALEIGFRTMAWTQALPMMASAPDLSPAFVQRVAASLLAQLEHLERHRSTWFSPNTHLTGEALALFITAQAWPALPHSAHRAELGFRILCEQALIQHRPDGSYFEQTTWYQAYTVAIFVEFLRWAKATGRSVPAPVVARIHQAARALRAFTRADGTIPLIGDDDGGRLLPLGTPAAADMSDVLCRAAVCFGDPALLTPGGAGRWTLAWLSEPDDWDRLLRLERETHADVTPRQTVLRDGGWVILTEPYPGDPARGHHAIFDTGPHGALSSGHAHADALSLSLAVRGVDIIVDPGTGAYADPMRSRYRSTSQHATVTVDRTDSSQQGSAFGWTTIAKTALVGSAQTSGVSWADAWHDGYERLADPVRHRRTIGRLTGRYWIVLDSLSCTASHHVSITFPAASGTRVTTSPDQRQHAFARGGVTAHITLDPRLASTVEARQVSPAYGVEQPAPALVAEAVIDGPVTFCTIIAADEDCGPVSVDVIGERCWQVTHRRGTDVVVAPRGDVRTVGDVAFDGTWMAALRETAPADGDEVLVACGAGTLTFGTRSMPLAADDTVWLHRVGSGWTTQQDS